MTESLDLETVIADSVNDATFDDSSDSVDAAPDTSTDTPVEPETPVETTPDAEPTETTEVTAPGAGKNEPTDEFERMVGVQAMGIAGRENRIPYSRVKKITEKAVADVVEAAVGRKLVPGEKALDVVKQHVAELPALRTKVTDYEARLDKVGEFEDVMANNPEKFLQLLARVPAYEEFFKFVENAYNAQVTGAQSTQAVAAAAPTQAQVAATDGMPEPNEELADGTKVYNMDGLKSLLAWNAQQVENKVSKQFTDRYQPMEAEWKQRKYVEATLPVVRAQIAEAQTWPLFKDNEGEITQALEANRSLTLEGAYRQVVFPKLIADRNTMRQGLVQEISKAPAAPSIPVRAATKPAGVATGPKTLEQIIAEQVESLKR